MITHATEFASIAHAHEGASADDLALGITVDPRLRAAARAAREPLVARIERELGPFDPLHLRALLEIPRERFVRPEDLGRACDDTPLALDDKGLSTISAPHAYLLSFRLLDLSPGDQLVELGSGSGYGAALAAFIVGARGAVTTVEIDEALTQRAARLLEELEPASRVRVLHMDAMESAPAWAPAARVVATFAVPELPSAWLAGLEVGGRLVAPVGPRDRDQRLVLAVREPDGIAVSDHGGVRYVSNRGAPLGAPS